MKCIHCGSTDTTSKGARRTKTLGIRKIRRCKSCGRRFTPKNQKLVPHEGSEAPQAKTAESVEPEAGDTSQVITSEADEPGKLETHDSQTPTSIGPEEPGDGHQTVGL